MTDLLMFVNSTDDSKSLKEILKPLMEQSGQSLTIVINRRAVLKSAMLALKKANFSFDKPLKVVFSGEDAEDEGGPKREFFRYV